MPENAVLKAIQERRSIRKYESRPVPKDIIEQLLSSAAYSPSAMNSQPWEFSVVTNREKILELSTRAKASALKMNFPAKYNERFLSKEDTLFYQAPLLIFISAPKSDGWTAVDCGIAAQTLFLAAHSLGLGSCFIGLAKGLTNDAEARKMLGISEGNEIIAPLIFGYPAEKKETPERKPKVAKRI